MELYYHTICPFSRLVKILLHEYNYEFKTVLINFWQDTDQLGQMNPALELPVLKLEKGELLKGSYPICEYFEEIHSNFTYKSDPIINAEIRRLNEWFGRKFYQEVTRYYLNEKIIAFYKKNPQPNLDAIKYAKYNLEYHLDYLSHLLENKDWLIGDDLTLADFYAGSQISLLDYLGLIDWEYYEIIKNWYVILKSRPSFRKILTEQIAGFKKSKTYELLDY